MERLYALAPRERSERWRRLGGEVYRVIARYVSGNLLMEADLAGTIRVGVHEWNGASEGS